MKVPQEQAHSSKDDSPTTRPRRKKRKISERERIRRKRECSRIYAATKRTEEQKQRYRERARIYMRMKRLSELYQAESEEASRKQIQKKPEVKGVVDLNSTLNLKKPFTLIASRSQGSSSNVSSIYRIIDQTTSPNGITVRTFQQCQPVGEHQSEPIQCFYCKIQLANRTDLEKHLITKHPIMKVYRTGCSTEHISANDSGQVNLETNQASETTLSTKYNSTNELGQVNSERDQASKTTLSTKHKSANTLIRVKSESDEASESVFFSTNHSSSNKLIQANSQVTDINIQAHSNSSALSVENQEASESAFLAQHNSANTLIRVKSESDEASETIFFSTNYFLSNELIQANSQITDINNQAHSTSLSVENQEASELAFSAKHNSNKLVRVKSESEEASETVLFSTNYSSSNELVQGNSQVTDINIQDHSSSSSSSVENPEVILGSSCESEKSTGYNLKRRLGYYSYSSNTDHDQLELEFSETICNSSSSDNTIGNKTRLTDKELDNRSQIKRAKLDARAEHQLKTTIVELDHEKGREKEKESNQSSKTQQELIKFSNDTAYSPTRRLVINPNARHLFASEWRFGQQVNFGHTIDGTPRITRSCIFK